MCLANEQEQKQVILQESLKVSEKLEQNEPLYRAPVQITDVSEASEEAKRQAEQLAQMQSQTDFGPVRADRAADGAASQHLRPAKNTYKARRAEKRRAREEEKRHAAEAREHCPVGDIVTYNIKHQLEDYHTQRTNSIKNYLQRKKSGLPEERNLSEADGRMLRCFFHGFRTDEAGRPATAADEKYKQEDEKFYGAFCSTDYTRRAPYLQRMVEEVLSYNLKEDMFSDRSLRSNAAGLKCMADRIVYMKNILRDKNNAFFFDTPLSPVKREDLEQALGIASNMAFAFGKECQKRGVEPDKLEAPYISEPYKITEYSELAKGYAAQYKGTPKEYQRIKDSIKQAKPEPPTSKIYHPEPEIYHQVRSALENDVQKILDCDVEKLSALSDKDLRKRRAELDKLYAASLKVEKCLPIRHPYQHKLTLKDDLIGQRKLKYEYKSAVLRGLAERADGFTKQGEKRIEAASTRYRNQMTPGTHEFREFFNSLPGSLFEHYAIPPKFDEVRMEFNALRALPKESRKGELAEAVERLGDNAYFSLAYSEKQLKDMGMPPTIKGYLFRNLNNFPVYEAAQTLLTPEQLRQMLINLGAGAGLTHDSEKKTRDEAIEKNNAGLDTYRKVLTAQYDMLERKYGNSLEKLTLRELQEHYLDIAKDFADIQEDAIMAERFPGFIRKDNPDDERLLNRINYYSLCGSVAMGLINYIAGMAPEGWASDENIQKRISDFIDMTDDSRKARAYLMEKGEGFQHPLDWSQKVREPITDDIKHQMEDYYQRHANSQKSYFKSHTNQSGVDPRMVDAYTHGFRTDETGRPATADDERYQREDEELYDAFCSTDYKKREPYLQRIVEEVLSFDLEKDMFSDNSLQNNTARLKDIAQRLLLLDNQINDENNRFFFRELSPVTWNALGQALEMAPLVGTSLGVVCGAKGVKENDGSYGEQEDIDMFSPQVEMFVPAYQEKLEEYRSMKDILKSAVAIEERVGRIGTVDAEHLPAAEFYQHVRSLLEPEVKKLLELNVEDLHTMSNGDILKLYNASLDVDKCLTHKHPDQPERTMKDELTGERESEYEHKLSVLRGLAESAAGHDKQGERQ